MKTYTQTQTFKLFTFNELSADAQERAEENYLNNEGVLWMKNDLFQEWAKDYAEELGGGLFNVNEVLYSLRYCQGDGVEIGGTIDALAYLKQHETELKREFFELHGQRFKNVDALTDGDVKTISNTLEEFGTGYIIEVFEHYGSPYARKRLTAVSELSWRLGTTEETNERDVLRLLDILESSILCFYEEITNELKKAGYEWFYNLDESDYESLEEYYYTEDGEEFGRIEDIDGEAE